MCKNYFILVTVLAVGGCLHTPGPKNTTVSGESKAVHGAFMFIGPCKSKVVILDRPEFKGQGAEVVASLASSLIGSGIDALGNALADAAADDVKKTVVTSNVYSLSALYPVVESKNKEPVLTCMQIVRGEILPVDNKTDEGLIKSNSISSPLLPLRFVDNSAEIDYEPVYLGNASYEISEMELFAEILPIFSGDAVSFVPLNLKYNGLSSGESGNKRPRDLALTIGFVLPNKELTETNLSGRSINFGTVADNSDGISEIEYITEEGKISNLMQSQWMPISKNMKTQPLTVSAYISESREAGAFVKLLSSAFASSKEDIKTKIQADVKESITKKDPTEEELEKAKISKEIEKLTAQNSILVLEEELVIECNADEKPSTSSIALKEIKIYESKKLFNIEYPDDMYEGIQEPTKTCDAWSRSN